MQLVDCRWHPQQPSVLIMVPSSALVFASCALLALAAATDVQQCVGTGRTYENLSENVQLSPCKKPPCRLKKGTNQHITINFVTDKNLKQLNNHVAADVFGVQLPFVGVDGNTVCDKIYSESGDKVSCPLQAGTKYVYKDSFPVLAFYPSIPVKVHWALVDADNKDVICFEVPARIS